MIDFTELETERDGLPVLRVHPTWNSSGLWNPTVRDSTLLGMLVAVDGLPPALAEDFKAIQRLHDSQSSEGELPAEVTRKIISQSFDLAMRLSAEIGHRARVQCEVPPYVLTFLDAECVAAEPLVAYHMR